MIRLVPPATQTQAVRVRIFVWRTSLAFYISYRSSSVIEVQHLTKRYGRVTAVDDVSFRVERGEILGFLGPNGAGKTTTMRILTGYMPATEGKAIVAGFDVFDQPIEAKRRTGYLPETPPLYPDMTRHASISTFVAKIKGVPSADRSAARPARSWSARASPTWPTGCAASCRKATSSASASPRRSSTTPTCSSSTSRPPASTRSRSSRRAS